MSVKRPMNGMTASELMNFTLAELVAGQAVDGEAMRLHTIDIPGMGKITLVIALDSEHGDLLTAIVVQQVNAIRAAAGLPPREGPWPAETKEQ